MASLLRAMAPRNLSGLLCREVVLLVMLSCDLLPAKLNKARVATGAKVSARRSCSRQTQVNALESVTNRQSSRLQGN